MREGKASASVSVVVTVVALPGHVVRRVSVSVGCVDKVSFLCLDSLFYVTKVKYPILSLYWILCTKYRPKRMKLVKKCGQIFEKPIVLWVHDLGTQYRVEVLVVCMKGLCRSTLKRIDKNALYLPAYNTKMWCFFILTSIVKIAQGLGALGLRKTRAMHSNEV